MSDINFGNVFATPIAVVDSVLSDYQQMLDLANDIHRDYAGSEHFITNHKREMPAVTYWDTDDIIGKYPQLQSIADQLDPVVRRYAEKLAGNKVDVIRAMSWLCYQQNNSFHPKHNHWATTVNGVIGVHNINAIVYLQAEAEDQLELYWPTPIAPLSYLDPSLSSARASRVRIANNSAIIIPSWVDHGCDARKRETTKICMSINYQYRR